ncbi:uncharacterized protein LOC124162273 isoform X1 [Ischnura elegans]|uniref:uncharacterized protein LOC124162273 isoform X1 n=1 Tax=Ischnura elegans TaxID=197161 RepID=UPI001ED8B080|nr:uncharacterized protein LOC124162273 isoform X1 [Ischnura elegans]XP_046394706.1 uncharacterized protein LOC124162273 isoform X1 [Ischnura elegans]
MSPNMMTTILKRIYIPYCAIILPLLLLTCCPADSGLPAPREQITDVDENTLHELEDGLQNKYADGASSTNSKASHSAEDGYTEDQEKESCYELHQAHIPILPRYNWEGGNQHTIRTTAAAKIVVVRDGGGSCSTKKECFDLVHSEKMPTQEKECALKDNFYIGGDGTVIDGRGWDVSSYWYLNGLRNTSITVKFLGSHQSHVPSPEAIDSFEEIIAAGLRIGKLSLDYRITTMRTILKQGRYAGDGLQRKIEEWSRWANDSFLASMWEYSEPRALKFVTRKQWSTFKPIKEINHTLRTVEYILISNGGYRCSSRKDCVLQLKMEEEESANRYDDLLENFYIGDDRRLYEGRGWGIQPHWYIRGFHRNYISVRFFGEYQTESPPEPAIQAFKSLVMAGISVGRVSPNFNLISLRQIYNDSSLLGDAFTSIVEQWEPWKSAIHALTTSELHYFGVLPIMKHNEWSERPRRLKKGVNKIPIQNLIIRESGPACYTTKECIRAMNLHERTGGPNNQGVTDNIYIGSDGMAYEGRGWEAHPLPYLKYFQGSYATVNFLGSNNETEPSKLAILAFKSLIKIGVDLEFVAPDYRFFSFRQIYNNTQFLGEGLSKYVKISEHWSVEEDKMDDVQRAASGLLPLVFREDWKAMEPYKQVEKRNDLVEFVVVGEAGTRCYEYEDCITEIRQEQNNTIGLYGHISDNFYIGNDGNAYEGTGWEINSNAKLGSSEKKSIFVSFFGTFNESLPHDMALAAFRRLLNYGLSTSRLSPSYRIISSRQVCNCTAAVGERLHNEITKWDRWQDNANLTFDADRTTSRRIVLVPRSRWHAADRYDTENKPASPAEYLTMMDGGDNCFSFEDCVEQIRFARSMTRHGVDLENFFVGEDGRAYQGLGWDSRPFFRANCTECNFVVVKFIGDFKTSLPRVRAVRALKLLVKWGIEMGKISPDYRVVSLNQLCRSHNFLGESLDYSIRAWDHRWENMYVPINCGLLQNRLIPTEEWGSFSTVRQYMFRGPTRYIFVRNWGTRCYTVHQCTLAVKNEERGLDKWRVADNFYIGEDGNVYEGRGWYLRPMHTISSLGSSSINVVFFGRFEDEHPSNHAVDAFRNILLKQGLQSQLILEDFEVRIFPHYANGIKLKETLKGLSIVS